MLHLHVLDVWSNVWIQLGADLDVHYSQALAHLSDLGRAAAGGGGHAQHQLSVVLVLRRHRHVGVAAYGPVRFIENNELHVLERDPLVLQVVGYHLGRGDDDVVLDPERFPLLWVHLPGEDGDRPSDDHLPEEGSVLLHQRLRRCQ